MLPKPLKLILIAAIASTCLAGDGRPALDFQLKDQNGATVQLADLSDKIIVLEWTNPECPFVQRHLKQGTMKRLADKYKNQGVVWLAVNSTHWADQSANAKFAKDQSLSYAVLDDHEGTVGRAFFAKTTPHMFVLHQGQIAYQGAIDDDPRGTKEAEAHNYVAAAIDALLQDQPIQVTSTKAYGCSVKYK